MPRNTETRGCSGSGSNVKDRQSVSTVSIKHKDSSTSPSSTAGSGNRPNSIVSVNSSRGKEREDSNPSKRQLKIVTKTPTERTREMRVSLKEGVSVNKKELYENVCEWENAQAKKLNVEAHLKRNLEMCLELEVLSNEINKMKTADQSSTEEYKEKRIQGLMLLTKLRRMNRLFKLRLKIAKEEILEQRQGVDSDHLLLQNLLYEATHLNNQVVVLQDYKGMDEKIELIPEEQFYAEAPPSISKAEMTRTDPYQLRIARLEYEFIQREKLTEEVKNLEIEKKSMSELINEQQTKLGSIRPLLTAILEATKPAQKFFNMDVSDRKVMYNLAQYLPTPLYILYSSSTGYENSSPDRKDRFHASIGGNMEDAKEFSQVQQKIEEDSESEVEEMDVDDAAEVEEKESDLRKLRKHSSVFESKEDPKKKLIERHPLCVEWEINETCGDRITLQFFYLLRLGIISVKSKLEITTEAGKLADINMQSDNILCELFPDDLGLNSPNPSTIFQLEKVNIEDLSEFIGEIGRPYDWAQKLSGLNFLPSEAPLRVVTPSASTSTVQPTKALSVSSFANIFKLIRSRLISQSKLSGQLKIIESKIIQIPPEAKDLFPVKNTSVFSSWEPMDWLSYKAAKYSNAMIDWKHSAETSIYFKAEFERGRAKMIALVTLSLDFPECPPHFCLKLEQGTEERTSENDSALRDIEKELNVHAPEDFDQWGDILLSFQLQRLAYCMDILLETDFSFRDSAGPSEFGREKLLMNPCRGKNYRRPFKFMPVGGGYFLHRY